MALAIMRRPPALPDGGCGGEVITEQESLQDWLPSWEPDSGALEGFVGAPRLPLFISMARRSLRQSRVVF